MGGGRWELWPFPDFTDDGGGREAVPFQSRKRVLTKL